MSSYYEQNRERMLKLSTTWYHEKNTREKKEQKVKMVIDQQNTF
jgi:hypothetical protein